MLSRLISIRIAALVAASLALWMSIAWAVSAPRLPSDLGRAERARLERVAEAASVTTRVDTEAFLTRREVFEYLLDHPEFATHVTRALRVARYRIWQTSDGLFLDDGWGVTGHFSVVYAGAGTRIMYARGGYRQTAIPTVNGEAVAMIQYRITPAGDDRDLVNATVSGYVKLDSALLSFATKLAGSIAQGKADLEARRLMTVFARVSRAIDDNPSDVYERLRQRPDVPTREREEFGRLLNLR